MSIDPNCHAGFTDRAAENVGRARLHCSLLRTYYGDAEGDRAARSLVASLCQMISLGGTIAASDEMGLYTVTSYGMHVGMVFHRDRPETAAKRIGASLGLMDDEMDVIVRDLNKPDAPMPGEWSCHS